MNPPDTPLLLEVDGLTVSFRMYQDGILQTDLPVISDLSISAKKGEILAVVGSSGSGKSLLAHAILGLLPANATVTGSIRYDGDLVDEKSLRKLRGRELALIPQSATFLDPLMRVRAQVLGSQKDPERTARQRSIFSRLDLPPETERLYPFELSGGMTRRVLFSTALITDAELVIADEPTPGMHIDQALEALAILRELADAGKAVILITHDIDLAVNVAENVSVFYAGTTLEETPSADFVSGPDALRHPYTTALWHALPQHDFTPIDGIQPFPGEITTGCVFAARCPIATVECSESAPPLRELRGGFVRCFHAT